jgi:serine/threonine-protein kinase RsbW
MASDPQIPDVFRRNCEGRIGAVTDLTDALTQWASERGVPPKVMTSVSLILDELFSNVVLHGYHADPAGRIAVEAHIDPQAFTVTLTDQARAFNPLLVPEPDTSLSIEERQIGGLGLLFVRRTADHLAYERVAGADGVAGNRVTFSKRLLH